MGVTLLTNLKSLSHTASISNFSSQVSGYHDYHWILMSFCLFEICFWIYGFLFWFWWFRRVHKMCSIKCYCEFSSTLASPPGLMLFFFLFMSISINLIICFYIENESFHWRNQRCRRFKGDVEGRIIEQTNLGCLYAIMMSNIDFSFATSCCV